MENFLIILGALILWAGFLIGSSYLCWKFLPHSLGMVVNCVLNGVVTLVIIIGVVEMMQ